MPEIKYILRFDDICPTMNWDIWNEIEKTLDTHNVKPLLAVIPDCKDVTISFCKPHPEFWHKARSWQKKGYDIAIHGYSHVYTNRSTGLMGITRQSEFVGLSEHEQNDKIQRGLNILTSNGIKTKVWIAPSHSFDNTTIKVLKKNGINVISDGFGASVFNWKGVDWVPCQIWNRIIPQTTPGIYTICYHPSTWTYEDLKNFKNDISEFRDSITSIADVLTDYKSVSGMPLTHLLEVMKRKLKNNVKSILGL